MLFRQSIAAVVTGLSIASCGTLYSAEVAALTPANPDFWEAPKEEEKEEKEGND